MPWVHHFSDLLNKDEIKALAKAVHDEMYSIENTLKRRGYVYAREGDIKNVILPSTHSAIDKLYGYMASRTFRNVLKKMARKKSSIQQADFKADCEATKLKEYFHFLESSGILNKESPSSFILTLDINDFGYTLEWYVAELFKRELGCTAAWDVCVEGTSVGGDFDVLARVEAELAYVETKSASPDNITDSEVRHFLQRDQELDPDMSIFLVDSRDDLSGLVSRFEDIITPAVVEDAVIRDPNYHHKIHQLPDFGGIYHTLRRIFIVGSEPTILTSLRRCLGYYFAIVTHSTYLSRSKRMNFLSRE
jgi:hypothetical protein